MKESQSRGRRAFLGTALKTTGALAVASSTSTLLTGCVPPDAGPAGATGSAGITRHTAGSGREADLSATDALAQMQSGRLSAERYISALIDRAQEHRSLNAFITFNETGAIETAKRIDAARAANKPVGPLAGLALVINDNINTAGVPTTSGTPGLKDFTPSVSAPVLQALLEKGVIVIGKANMHELGLGVTSTNAAFGAVQNPYDVTRIPGGASGGTAAALAARFAPVGLGTDSVGSLRVPAALCGVVGMRPSVGNGGKERRYSMVGVAPVSHTRDTVGPMARSVADIVLIDNALTGAPAVTARPAHEIRLGVPRGYFWSGVDRDVASQCQGALDKLKAHGVTLVEADLPDVDTLTRNTASALTLFELYMDFPGYLWETAAPHSFWDVLEQVKSPDVQAVLKAGKSVTRDQYVKALTDTRPKLMQAYADYFEQQNVQAIVFPTVPATAPLIDPSYSGALSIDGVAQPGGSMAALSAMIRNVDPGSCAGLPGLSLPVGLASNGIPVGLSLDARAGGDADLLAIGMTLESILGLIAPPRLSA
ncbi:indoleacetamide hydrolase [Pararobbsia silviterrae]|uniref:Indoleacetamide hydrolase n=1 Tax=Pararobbsia silviterrae TaxID=1792498 RepID=A0A494XM50_9BURK|nr:indoleacetamide hydrolase [Pararobbsia silviterrae]RKP49746.1 indoleacetamide hydrolase [Pararobbsia silviterrae]